MSYTSNLLTLRNVVSQLDAFQRLVSNKELTVEEYFTYLPLFERIQKLAKVLDSGLVLELIENEEGAASSARFFFEGPGLKRLRDLNKEVA